MSQVESEVFHYRQNWTAVLVATVLAASILCSWVLTLAPAQGQSVAFQTFFVPGTAIAFVYCVLTVLRFLNERIVIQSGEVVQFGLLGREKVRVSLSSLILMEKRFWGLTNGIYRVSTADVVISFSPMISNFLALRHRMQNAVTANRKALGLASLVNVNGYRFED